MPELPEVETVARELKPLVVGQRVSACRFIDPFFADLDPSQLLGLQISNVSRVGKQVIFTFSASNQSDLNQPAKVAPPHIYMAIHLRMTGRLRWLPVDNRAPEKHVRAQLVLDRGLIAFHDVRRFGTICVTTDAADFAPPGIDPTTESLTPKWLVAKLKSRQIDIKSALLNQQIMCGIGNIYASEILYAARISPFRASKSLTEPELARVCKETKRILKKAITHCGTTFSDFQRAKGLTGSYRQYLEVYAREGKPCRRCQSPIIKVKQSGRSTYYCLICQ